MNDETKDKFEDEPDFDGDLASADEAEAGDESTIGTDHRDKSERRTAEKLWLVSYSDFMTIMMIFFLAMFGYTYIIKNQEKPQAILFSEFTSMMSDIKARLGDQIRLLDDVSRTTVELGEGVLFPSGKAELNPSAINLMRELAASIKRTDGDVIVEGHTDDVPIVSGRYKSNWELSSARAFSVVSQLARYGIEPSKLYAWGFGENRPVVPNDSVENRQRNRRINIVILKKVTVLQKKQEQPTMEDEKDAEERRKALSGAEE